ncbi:MAG: DNA-binding protein [Pirellula sp.]|nr:DNA-binding protein [Pirellula sp.]
MSSLLTRPEAAAYLRWSIRQIDAKAAAGEIPKVKLGRSVRFRKEDLDAYIERHLPEGGDE